MFKRKKGRYSEKKVNKERKVISYEDVPLDDYEQEKTDISPSAVKKIIIGVVIALVAGLIVFAFANRDKLTPENLSVWWTYDVLGNAGKGYPVNIVGSEVKAGNFTENQNRIAYASDTSFVTLNSSGGEIANVQLRHSKPVMKTNENKFLIYGLGEKEYQILSFDKQLYTGEAQSIIYTGDIASNGVYCFVTEGDGFLSELYVYNSDNNRIFKYSFSEYYINSVALNNDGSGCVACGLSSDGGAIKTGVYVLDFGKEEPVNKYEIPDDVIIDSKYISGRRAALVGENASYVIKIGAEEYNTVSYEDKPMINYCFSPKTGSFALALSKSGDGKNCLLVNYNDNGDKNYAVENEYGADSLSVLNGTIAVLDGNMIYAYNKSGDLKYSCDAGTGSSALILDSDKSAYVLSINQIRHVALSKPASPDSAQ